MPHIAVSIALLVREALYSISWIHFYWLGGWGGGLSAIRAKLIVPPEDLAARDPRDRELPAQGLLKV